MRALVGASVLFFSLIGTASAGTITAAGAVKALTNINQLQGIVGNGNFDEGPTSGGVPANVYSAQGLTWQSAVLSSVLPGCTNTGQGALPNYGDYTYFPAPIAGGGTHNAQANYFAGVATFSVTITQVGLTACTNGQQWLTVWGKNGTMLGEVTWIPAGDSAFVGIDTMGVPIGMVAYGNHSLYPSNTPYSLGGATNISDSWVWASGACTSDAQCDDGNPCTTDGCSNSVCVHLNNTSPCTNNPNLCLMNTTCSGGVCGGGTPVTCTALDGCHTAGTCNPSAGTCSNPVKPNGTACSDNNACTESATCENGACTGMTQVMCAAPTTCQNTGVCDTMTGMCKYTNKADGTACSDGNACTLGDVCMAGVCTGSPISCAAMDSCHDVGMCDTTSGMCTNPPKADGSACDDGDLCSTNDTCMGGTCMPGGMLACSALDACHVAGTCTGTTGVCSNPAAPDGTACPGGTCASGSCKTGAGTGGSAGTGGGSTTGTGAAPGTGGSSATGGSTGTNTSSGCKCGVVDASTGGTPAAALLMILALRRRRRVARVAS